MQMTAPGAALLAFLPLLAGASCDSDNHRAGPPAFSLPSLATSGACATVAIARDGLVKEQQAVGTDGVDVSQALFDIGSAAKSFTAAAIVLLAADGKLSLDASIARYVPHVPVDKRDITVAELLTHTSGLVENFTSDQTRVNRDDAVNDILKLRRTSGRGFRYSNAGYTLLAAIVERVAKIPFRQFVVRRLLEPSGMVSTGWYGDVPPHGTRPVDGHARGRDTGAAGTQAPASWATLGAGGMTSTATDLIRWLTAVNDDRLFNASWRTALFQGRVAIGAPGAQAAYGWVVGSTPDGHPIRLIGGDTDYGYTSDLRYYTSARVATVALSCSDTTPAVDLGHDLEPTALRA